MINIFVYVDALPISHVSAQNTPFIKSLLDEGEFYELENIMGYSFGIQSTIMTGKLPFETKHWMPYFYAPDSSSYVMKALSPIARKVRINVENPRLLKTLNYGIRSKILFREKAKINALPWSMGDRFYVYPYYYMNELPFFSQLKSELRKRFGDELLYFGPPINRNVVADVMDFLASPERFRLPENSFIVIYIDSLDHIGHAHGVGSSRWKMDLAKIDKALGILHEFLSQRVRHFSFAIFSDHGMCNVEQTLNIMKPLKAAGLNWRDFTFFIDATIMTAWFRDETSKHALLRILDRIGRNKVLIFDVDEDHEYLRRSGVLFRDRKYGDLIVQTTPGHMFFPNFYSDMKPFKGVHGFLPEERDQTSFLVLNSNSANKMSLKLQHIKDIKKLVLSLA